MNNENILKEAQRHFFRAMLAGWAGGVEAKPVPNEPGFKQTDYKDGDFRVLDKYVKGRDSNLLSSNLSTGTTTVWYFEEPVWVMTYGGQYREDEIPFLKDVLVHAYRKGEFHGCRGDSCASSGGRALIYSNSYRGDFKKFEGSESITARYDRVVLGYHWYHGMSLLPVR